MPTTANITESGDLHRKKRFPLADPLRIRRNALWERFALHAAIDSLPALIAYKDLSGAILGCNKAFAKRLGKSCGEIAGLSAKDFFDRKTALACRRTELRVMHENTEIRYDEVLSFRDKTSLNVTTRQMPFYDRNKRILGTVAIYTEKNADVRTPADSLAAASRDPLTGLFTRHYIEREFSRLEKAPAPISVITGDINGLYSVNRTFGYDCGNDLLIRASLVFKECCRPGDILARTGGDGFLIILPETDAREVRRIAGEIQKAIARDGCNSPDLPELSLSIGYAASNDGEKSLIGIISEATDFMNKHKLMEPGSLRGAMIAAMKSAMHEKSDETVHHEERIVRLSIQFGEILGLSDQELCDLELLSTLHDIGKISLDPNILKKTETLCEWEWEEIRKHPVIGSRIAESFTEIQSISHEIRCHHERWDGIGYPDGLTGTQIPLLSRIPMIADAFDAMTNGRGYKKAIPLEEAIAEITLNAGTQFDPHIVETLLKNPSCFH